MNRTKEQEIQAEAAKILNFGQSLGLLSTIPNALGVIQREWSTALTVVDRLIGENNRLEKEVESLKAQVASLQAAIKAEDKKKEPPKVA